MELQEILALVLVAAVVAAFVVRRRRRPRTGCGDCAGAGGAPSESVIRFYRRTDRPGTKGPPPH